MAAGAGAPFENFRQFNDMIWGDRVLCSHYERGILGSKIGVAGTRTIRGQVAGDIEYNSFDSHVAVLAVGAIEFPQLLQGYDPHWDHQRALGWLPH